MNDNASQPPAVLIAGPTASGKSKVALHIAERVRGEVINADSMQVYRQLQVLTARPDPADEARVPHHLYGTVSVHDSWSVADWLKEALDVIAGVRARGNLPIVVGGTGLYFKALLEGIAEIPEIPESVRREARSLQGDLGAEAFHEALRQIDPLAAAGISPADRQRSARAWEVMTATGRSIVDWQGGDTATESLGGEVLLFALVPDRAALYARCDERLGRMIEEGALEEVSLLGEMGVEPDHPVMKALGVPHFLRHLGGETDLETALAAARTATRQYAKRQFTWIRNQMISWNHVQEQDYNNITHEIFAKMSDFGLTPKS